jgi:hypothetical protein
LSLEFRNDADFVEIDGGDRFGSGFVAKRKRPCFEARSDDLVAPERLDRLGNLGADGPDDLPLGGKRIVAPAGSISGQVSRCTDPSSG